MNTTTKTCLVTGADGFIGSHLTELLLEKGYKVRALAQYNSFNNWGWLEDVAKNGNLEIITGDVRDPHFCKSFTQEIDIVFHLAGLIAIPYSYIAPDSYVGTNVLGTLNMCQASRDNGVGRFIHVSTSQVYGTAQYVPIDEKHPKHPQSPYAASKIGADAMAMSFYHSFDFPVSIARPFNTYGPRESARDIVPSIITQLVAGKKTLKVGDLTPTRDMSYVRDICKGIWLIAENDNTVGREINICSNSEISMAEVLHKIKSIMQVHAVTDAEPQRMRPAGSEVYRLLGDNSLIRELTGFTPDYSIDQGLQLTCEWFMKKENSSKYKASIYNV
jgi:NAD dependent epimerase/dehydratase